MKSIATVGAEVLENISANRRVRREELMARHGWEPGVHCAACGDTGIDPDSATPCRYCRRGLDRTKQEERLQRWQRMMPSRYRPYTLGNHPNWAAAETAQRWLDQVVIPVDDDTITVKGPNLMIHGPVGTGKTGLAIGILRQVWRSGTGVRYGTVPALMDDMRPSADPENARKTKEALERVPLLLLDDLGAEKESEWVAEQLYLIVNARYGDEKPIIITTNSTRQEIEDSVGTRVMSRLMENMQAIRMDGPDRRQHRHAHDVHVDTKGTDGQKERHHHDNDR